MNATNSIVAINSRVVINDDQVDYGVHEFTPTFGSPIVV